MDDLIKVVQLPVIEERLKTLKDRWEQHAADAESMVCTEDAVPAVKAFRAEMRKEFDEVETLRKAVKKAVMEPYERFEAVYKDCVTHSYQKADKSLAGIICVVENDIKRRCEEGLKDYFYELTAVHHLEWLEYERAGIKIDMASAKAKRPERLRKQLREFVEAVRGSVDAIMKSDDAPEIMEEYKRSLSVAGAFSVVQERHRRIEQERAEQETRKVVLERETEAVRRFEALAPPVQVEPPKIYSCTFTVRTTMNKLKRLKDFLNMEGIEYE